jgi:hypothetical protein
MPRKIKTDLVSPDSPEKFESNLDYLSAGLSLGRIVSDQVENLIRTSGLSASDEALIRERLTTLFGEGIVLP